MSTGNKSQAPMDTLLTAKKIARKLKVPREIRVKGRNLLLMARLLSQGQRVLPDFMLIGAQKGGTSSLFLNLLHHPEVIPPLHKEMFFFDDFYDKGLRWYLAHFPQRTELENHRGKINRCPATCDGTITYLTHPLAPSRIREHVPGARFLVLLRNPVNRAYSHYRHMIRDRFETREFSKIINWEYEHLQPLFYDKNYPDKLEDPHFALNTRYLSRGLYAIHLRRWFKYFPREQFYIIENKNYFANEDAEFQSILRFLGLSEWKPEKHEKINVGTYRSPMPDNDRELLEDFFKPHNEDLNKLLKWDTDW